MRLLALTLSLGLSLLGCSGGEKDDSGLADGADGSDGSDGGDGGDGASGDRYDFVGAASGQDSVSYGGQVFRQLLIDDMKGHLGGLTARLDGGSFYPEAGDVTAELEFYFEFDSAAYGALEHGVSVNGTPLQTTYDAVSTDKDLVGKLAGNDAVGQHKDWSTDFVGWEAEGVSSPESLLRHWFARIDAQAVAWSLGDLPLDPSGQPVPAVYVTAQGVDLQQLTEKFLRAAVAFSQGTDDYLDDDIDGSGLLADHSAVEEGKPYTALEHAWDEGFGYFGAARDYADWSDADIAELANRDVDGDGFVDLTREVNWGHSTSAAKRDLGSNVATDYTAEVWAGFHGGRKLLAETAGRPLTADELNQLRGHRDRAVLAWEACIAATVVHYINDTLQDMGAIDTDAYSFGDHAKHWSELKGFALALQFNPRSPLSDGDFATLHALIGQAPVLEDAGPAALQAYADDLREARALVGDAYSFAADNLGDDNGENGW